MILWKNSLTDIWMDLKVENGSMKRNTSLWYHAWDGEIQRKDIFLQKYLFLGFWKGLLPRCSLCLGGSRTRSSHDYFFSTCCFSLKCHISREIFFHHPGNHSPPHTNNKNSNNGFGRGGNRGNFEFNSILNNVIVYY